MFLLSLEIYIIKKIGIGEYINACLVNNDIRSAMMIQPIDYINGYKKSKQIVKNILKQFPKLKTTESIQEIIISKKSYKPTDINDNIKLGNVLGYPCANSFNKIIDEPIKPNIVINFVAIVDGQKFQLIANVCPNKVAKDSIKYFENLVVRANLI